MAQAKKAAKKAVPFESRLAQASDQAPAVHEPVAEEGVFVDSQMALHKMKHAVLISKEDHPGPTVRYSNGTLFHDVPVGIETKVSEETFQAMSDSDVPFTSRKL